MQNHRTIPSEYMKQSTWDPADFEVARASDHRFGYAKQSWREQKGSMDAAVAGLASGDQRAAEAGLVDRSQNGNLRTDIDQWIIDQVCQLEPVLGQAAGRGRPRPD